MATLFLFTAKEKFQFDQARCLLLILLYSSERHQQYLRDRSSFMGRGTGGFEGGSPILSRSKKGGGFTHFVPEQRGVTYFVPEQRGGGGHLYSEFMLTEPRSYFACLVCIVFYANTFLNYQLRYAASLYPKRKVFRVRVTIGYDLR